MNIIKYQYSGSLFNWIILNIIECFLVKKENNFDLFEFYILSKFYNGR